MKRKWCNTIRKEHVGQEVFVQGWVFRRRDHGGVIFIDLRDRSGLVQLVFAPEIEPKAHEIAEQLRSEYTIGIRGKVRARLEQDINPKLDTGEIEIEVYELELYSKSLPLPFSLDENEEVGEEIRLKYRYLDMRRLAMKHNVIMRHRLVQAVRRYLDEQEFLEIETPVLNKSTPEGARDFLVPSRINPGDFYALPQSPQIFKQILMVAGMERYYQIARCFRDEDLRADRQPEFTQIDMELSFITEEDLYEIMEGLWQSVLKEVFGIEVAAPFPRLTYEQAMERYGRDAPDTRFGMELVDVGDIAAKSSFKVFQENAERDGYRVKCIRVPEGAAFSRGEIDNLTAFAGRYGAKGLAWMKHTDNGLESSITKFFSQQELTELVERTESQPGSLLLFVADSQKVVHEALGQLRLHIARQNNMIPEGQWNFTWVVDFPAFEYDQEEGRFYSMHHPFTNIHSEDATKILDGSVTPEEAGNIRARAYDLVLNGSEIGGGSIRIHDQRLQQAVFDLLGIPEEEAHKKFSFLMDALKYGAPPHGGIAFGLDRILMLFLNQGSIRDVIPFPKTQKGQCLMSQAPSPVEPDQLKELSLRLMGTNL